MSQAIRPATAGVIFALTAAALYGVSGAIAADVFDVVSPARVSQIRAFIAAAVLVPYAWYRGLLNPLGQIRWLALLGLNLALVGLTFYWALDRLGVGPGATMQFLGPFMVLAFMAFWYKGFGLIANVALTFNLVVIVAVLSIILVLIR